MSDMSPITLSVTGTSCASCLGRVQRALVADPGVTLAVHSATAAAVNLATEAVHVMSVNRAMMRSIRPILFWASGYNVALIPVAAPVIAPPAAPQSRPILQSLGKATR